MKANLHKNIPRKLFIAVMLSTLFGLLTPHVRAVDVFTPDSEGCIRHWVMLAPIALGEGDTGSEAIFRQQVRGEAELRPKAGDKVTVGGK